jgi:hypothetical protein
MDEHDINDLLNSAHNGHPAGNDFEKKLLNESTAAFKRARDFRSRLRITGLILLLAVITSFAFLAGRLSMTNKTWHQQQIAQQTNPDNNVTVPRDLVAWLDAAKFFTQLGMNERAELSYKQASLLIPLELMQKNIADIGQNNALAMEDKNTGKTNSEISENKQKETYEKKISIVLAKNFGD